MCESTPVVSDSCDIGDSAVTFEQLSALIKSPPGITDPDIVAFTLKNQEKTIRMSLKGLNASICDIRQNWPTATPLQIYIAYESCNNDIETLLLEMGKDGFKKRVEDSLNARIGNVSQEEMRSNSEEEDMEDPPENDKLDNDYVETYTPEYGGGRREYHRRSHSVNITTDEEDEDGKGRRTRRPKDSVVPVDPMLPAPKEVRSQDWEHWSLAKRKSYIGGMKNPNAYFYRNVAPGEPYKTGPFTAEEKRIFVKRVEEFRDKATGSINGEWGLFSRALPGRVGYQCSNYYRKLVDSGELHDPMYIKDENGFIHHLSHIKSYQAKLNGEKAKKVIKVKPSKPHKHKIIDPDRIKSLSLFSSKVDIAKPSKQKKQIQITQYAIPSSSSSDQSALGLYDRLALLNPIPGWTDPLTGDVMHVPAISPDFSLLDYNTWLHAIKSTPEDPFTKRPITKRQITVLNFDNWSEYKDKIEEKYAELYAPPTYVIQ